MSTDDIISAIDTEISRLTQARDIIASLATGDSTQPTTTTTRPKRTMSAAARKRIAAAMRKRWAAKKRAK